MSMKLNEGEITFEFSFFESGDSLLNLNKTQIKKQSKKASKSKMIVLFVFIVIISSLCYFAEEQTKEYSLFLFKNKDYNRCILLNKLDLYQYDIRYFFLFFMYSYLNIYATFCYLAIDILMNVLNDLIRFQLFDSRPFWDNSEEVFPCKCELSPSNPSPNSSNSILFLTIIYFLKEKQRYRIRRMNATPKKLAIYNDENELKDDSSDLKVERFYTITNLGLNILLILIIGLIIFVDTIPLLQNIEYLYQSIYGLFIGFAFYYWVFHIVAVKHLNTHQMSKIINQPWIILTFSIILLIIILFIFNNSENSMKVSNILNIQKFCKFPNDFNANQGILKNCIFLFEILGAYSGLLLEYKKTFNSDIDKFVEYNVKSKYEYGYFEGQNAFIKLIRFLFLFFIEILFFRTIIEFWLKNNLEGTIRFISLSLTYFFKGFFFFFIMKKILGKLHLINDKIFEKDDDDEE